MTNQPPRTNVYIDGFNLYYGAAKGTPYRWVNLRILAQQALSGVQVNRIRYFTALVTSDSKDPQRRQRQETYIRALETLPGLSVHYGHYLQSKTRMRLADPPAPPARATVEVIKMEEKGSDVNLATYMLVDAFRKDCDQLVVITNDSDLAEPIRILNKEMDIPVVVLNPHSKDTAARLAERTGRPVKYSPSVSLRTASRFFKDIRSSGPASHMALSQFAEHIVDASGRTISKPADW